MQASVFSNEFLNDGHSGSGRKFHCFVSTPMQAITLVQLLLTPNHATSPNGVGAGLEFSGPFVVTHDQNTVDLTCSGGSKCVCQLPTCLRNKVDQKSENEQATMVDFDS